MKRIAAVLFFVTIFASLGLSASSNNQSFDLYMNSNVELDDYEFRFSNRNGEQSFSIGRDRSDTLRILERKNYDGILDSMGENIEVNENLSYVMNDLDSDDEGLYIDLTVNSSEDIFASSTLESNDPDRIFVEQGEDELTLNLEIENTGVVDEEYNLSAVTESPITADFRYQDFSVSQIHVPRGESRSITVEITVPEHTPEGIHNLVLEAEDRSMSTQNIELSVRGQQIQQAELNMNLQESYTRVSPGEEVNVPVSVGGMYGGMIRDGGPSTAFTDVALNIEGPDGWNIEVRPDNVASLDQFQQEEFMLSITAPENAEPGDYFIDVSATSSESSTEAKQIRVNVNEDSAMRYVGILIMVLSLGSLAAVYRKFGRR